MIRSARVPAAAAVIVLGLTGCTTSNARPGPTPAGSSPSTAPNSAPSSSPGRVATPAAASQADGSPRGLTVAQQKVDRADASSTAIAFAVRLEAWDTNLDSEPGDAAVRAVSYATPKLGQQLVAHRPESSAPGARWDQLVAHHGWVSVSTELGGLGPTPKDTATAAVRGVTTTPTDHGAGHWTSWADRTERMTYVIDLTRAKPGAAWSVSKYTIL